jgi:hypothetical protein
MGLLHPNNNGDVPMEDETEELKASMHPNSSSNQQEKKKDHLKWTKK